MSNYNIDSYFKTEIQKFVKVESFEIEYTGEFKRVKDQKGKSNFCYIASSWHYKGKEYAILSFIDWSEMTKYQRLNSWSDNDLKHFSKEDLANFKAECETKNKERKEKEETERAKKIKEALEIYEKFKDNKLSLENYKNTYLNDKGFTLNDLKADSSLFIGNDYFGEFIGYPLYLNNEFVGIKRLYQDKKYTKGLTGFHRLGNLEKENLNICFIVEGYATGLSVHLALNKTVFIADNCHKLKDCVKEAISQVRAINPNCLIIFACDRDKSKAGEIAAIKACKGQLGVSYKLPYLSDSLEDKEKEKLDFDDLRTLESLDSIRKQLDPDKLIENFYQDYSSFSEKSLKAMIREREKEVKSLEIESLNKKDLIELEKKLNCKDLITELLNREIAFTHMGGKNAFIDNKALTERDELIVKDKEHLIDKYSNKLGFTGFGKEKAKYENYFKIYLTHKNRKYYEGIIFDPSPKALENSKSFNLFKGFKYAPNQEIDTSFFWNHLFEILCSSDKESYEYARKWLSHIFQKPYELSRTAIVIPNSGQGTGKGSFLSQISKLLGSYYTEISDIERLGARFNSLLSGKLLINANEAIWGGEKKKEGGLKALITDPTCPLELKHKEPVIINNYARLIVTSNEDWAVPVGLDDRRFVFLEASDKRKNDPVYFNDFLKKTNQERFLKSLMFDLMNENIEGFNFTKRPEKSFELAKGHKLASMNLVLSWWNDYLNNPMDLEFRETMMRDELRLNFENWCTKNKKTHIPSSEKFWHEFKRYLPKEVNSDNSNRKFLLGSQKRVISGLNQEECLNYINKLLGLKESESFELNDIPF